MVMMVVMAAVVMVVEPGGPLGLMVVRLDGFARPQRLLSKQQQQLLQGFESKEGGNNSPSRLSLNNSPTHPVNIRCMYSFIIQCLMAPAGKICRKKFVKVIKIKRREAGE